MPPKLPVVINTGPLIALAAALGDLEALAHVAMLVVVPGEVFTECVAGIHYDNAADKVRAASCCDIRPVFPALPQSLLDLLDIGEAAVIRRLLGELLPIEGRPCNTASASGMASGTASNVARPKPTGRSVTPWL